MLFVMFKAINRIHGIISGTAVGKGVDFLSCSTAIHLSLVHGVSRSTGRSLTIMYRAKRCIRYEKLPLQRKTRTSPIGFVASGFHNALQMLRSIRCQYGVYRIKSTMLKKLPVVVWTPGIAFIQQTSMNTFKMLILQY